MRGGSAECRITSVEHPKHSSLFRATPAYPLGSDTLVPSHSGPYDHSCTRTSEWVASGHPPWEPLSARSPHDTTSAYPTFPPENIAIQAYQGSYHQPATHGVLSLPNRTILTGSTAEDETFASAHIGIPQPHSAMGDPTRTSDFTTHTNCECTWCQARK